MKENAVEKAIRTIGVCIIVIGIIGAFCCGGVFPSITYTSTGRIDSSYNWGLVVAVVAGSIISGSAFIGLSEIIRLLQSAVDKLDKIADDSNSTQSKQHSAIKDIESNLPKI